MSLADPPPLWRHFHVRTPLLVPMGGPWRGCVRARRFPKTPVFQPCLVPAHPIWKWGAGFISLWSLSCNSIFSPKAPGLSTPIPKTAWCSSPTSTTSTAPDTPLRPSCAFGNSASEPDATITQPLDAWTVAALMGGVEGLCEHMGAMTDAMLETARACTQDVDCADPTHDAPASIQ